MSAAEVPAQEEEAQQDGEAAPAQPVQQDAQRAGAGSTAALPRALPREEEREGGEDPEEDLKSNGIEAGKDEYAKGNYAEALKKWTNSMRSVKYMLDKNLYKDKPEQRAEVYQMELRLSLNMSQGYLKTREWSKAIEFADKALEREPSSTKALYRKATALNNVGNFREALQVCEQLLQIEPDSAAGAALLAETKRSNQLHQQKARKMAQRAIGGIERDNRVPPTFRDAVWENFWYVLSVPGQARIWCCSLPRRGYQTVTQRYRSNLNSARARTRRSLKQLMGYTRGKLADMTPNSCKKRAPGQRTASASRDYGSDEDSKSD